MAATALALQRLSRQGLSQAPFARADEVVAWLGAVQAQDFPGALWSLGLRIGQATADVIDRSFAGGTILRTHVLRPTWHFVTPTDIRWLLALTAPRVNAVSASMYRRLALDEALFARSNAVIARAVQGGQQRTRAELGSALAAAGIVAEGVRLGYLVFRAELDAVVCSGPRRGKQFTYALLDERAPQARTLQREEAVAELTRRYFAGHGPATIQDFVWWSGLTAADAKAGLALVGAELEHAVIDGKTYWRSASPSPVVEASPNAILLPTYDEFLVGYRGFGRSLAGGRERAAGVAFSAPLVIDGTVVGNWRRTFKKGTAVVEIAPFAPLTAAEGEAVAAAAQRYGDFLGLHVVLR